MHQETSIAIIGDFDPTFEPHSTIASSIEHSCRGNNYAEERIQWIDTITCNTLSNSDLSAFNGFWIAPGSPYKSLDGALHVIEYARLNDIPLLGTCGGFQHIVLEYARHVVGFTDAQHAEYDPYSSHLFIDRLDCSLAGQTMIVELIPHSVAYAAYGVRGTTERYYCDFGLNPVYTELLEGAGMVISGIDADGAPRIIELPNLRFFLGTLFVPQARSSASDPHPIVTAFMDAAHRYRLGEMQLREAVEDGAERH